MKDWQLISRYHTELESDKWLKEIPYIKFPNNYEVRAVPGFGGAVIRYNIKYKEAFASVYLDCYDQLGCYGSPYWEVYPYESDVIRCDMEDTESLLKYIQESIDSQL